MRIWNRPAVVRGENIEHRDGTVQPRRRRRLATGGTFPAAKVGLTWQDLVAPAPNPTGGARANKKHPSRKHDLDRSPSVFVAAKDIQGPVLGQPRRRDRRAAARAAAKRGAA